MLDIPKVTAAALHILQHKAHSKYKERASPGLQWIFEPRCNQRVQNYPQFLLDYYTPHIH